MYGWAVDSCVFAFGTRTAGEVRRYAASTPRRTTPFVAALICVVTATISNAVAQTSPSYSLHSIGTLGDGTLTTATAVNDCGHVIGAGYIDEDKQILHAFYYRAGRIHDIGPAAVRGNLPAINNHDEILSYDTGGQDRAWLIALNRLVDLPAIDDALPGAGVVAYDINDLGVIAGEADNSIYMRHPVVWWRGRPYDLDPDGYGGSALAVNNRAEVAGDTTNKQTNSHCMAFRWHSGALNLLPLLPETDRSRAVDMNDAGTIAGWCWDGIDGNIKLCEWTYDSVVELPKHLGKRTTIRAINNDGIIVGDGLNESDNIIGVLWYEEQVYDINDLIINGENHRVWIANDINSHGQIVGGALNYVTGKHEAVILDRIQ